MYLFYDVIETVIYFIHDQEIAGAILFRESARARK